MRKMFFCFRCKNKAFPSQRKQKTPSALLKGFCCCPSWIRTNIVGTKNRSPAVRRSGILLRGSKNTKFLIYFKYFLIKKRHNGFTLEHLNQVK